MYPFLRMFKEMARASRMPPLGLFDTHVSHHLCWPWDLDPWVELNNGRTLTLYDLGRLPLGARTGLHRVLKAKGWGMTVAGSSVRYRRRVTMFARITTYSRCLGWDERFLYTEQSMWTGGECASQVLIRSAVVGSAMGARTGIVPPSELAVALGAAPESPELPDWVKAWIAAEATRPWPPEGPGRLGAS
ncbi:thioesterase family protein [Rhodobacter calidifons]|uniref:Thioesterase n=1 Tax=Rhodobacter calidifons TaxID=2715277 RepID=A0ABX0G9A9_9RHOB|nr:thioesterase family protein [Rhodobacter calidifons]NHB77888.1 thioesterase [Rhodobacter calidifons]